MKGKDWNFRWGKLRGWRRLGNSKRCIKNKSEECLNRISIWKRRKNKITYRNYSRQNSEKCNWIM